MILKVLKQTITVKVFLNNKIIYQKLIELIDKSDDKHLSHGNQASKYEIKHESIKLFFILC